MPYLSYSSLPRRLMLWATFLGLFAASYLLIVYTTGGPIICGVAQGCETVRASVWAYPWGIPLPLFGVLFYLVILKLQILSLFFPAFYPRLVRGGLLILVSLGIVDALFLTGIQAFSIHAYCTWCLTSAVAQGTLFVATLIQRNERAESSVEAIEMKYFFYSVLIAFVIGFGAMIGLVAAERADKNSPAISLPTGVATSTVLDAQLIHSDTPIEGPFNAQATIVEFLDYQCPGCGAYFPLLKKIREEYKGKMKYVIRQFPLTEIHPYAKGAAIAATCASKQGKLFEYSDVLFSNQQYLRRTNLEQYAEEMKLDMDAFKKCLDDPETATFVIQERKEGEALGVRYTPTIFMNGKMMEDPPDEQALRALIDKK